MELGYGVFQSLVTYSLYLEFCSNEYFMIISLYVDVFKVALNHIWYKYFYKLHKMSFFLLFRLGINEPNLRETTGKVFADIACSSVMRTRLTSNQPFSCLCTSLLIYRYNQCESLRCTCHSFKFLVAFCITFENKEAALQVHILSITVKRRKSELESATRFACV